VPSQVLRTEPQKYSRTMGPQIQGTADHHHEEPCGTQEDKSATSATGVCCDQDIEQLQDESQQLECEEGCTEQRVIASSQYDDGTDPKQSGRCQWTFIFSWKNAIKVHLEVTEGTITGLT